MHAIDVRIRMLVVVDAGSAMMRNPIQVYILRLVALSICRSLPAKFSLSGAFWEEERFPFDAHPRVKS